MTVRRLSAAVGALLLGVVVLLGVSVLPAQAAQTTVTLGPNGPSPGTVTIARGATVTFVNRDSVSHTITRTAGRWTYNQPIAAGEVVTTPAFTASGTYGYSDRHVVLLISNTDVGSIVVPTATASPSASATRKPSPKPSATPSRGAQPSSPPSSVPTPLPSASGTGTAIGPGIGSGSFPPSSPGQSSVPTPNVAPGQSGSASPAPAGGLTYGDKAGVVQGSAHRYGLPAALAVVAMTGIVSLLVRLLLAEPAARRRRTPVPESSVEGTES
jgi:plastocyanin